MYLDEQTRAFIDASRAKARSSSTSISLADYRGAAEEFRSLGFPREDVARVLPLQIPVESGASVPARLYVPDSPTPPPVVVWAHGGSWVRVNVDVLDGHFRVMANRSGCAIAAVDYRLSPEARFPVALEDVYATGRFVRENASDFDCDPSRIGVGGESSGGNLAAAAVLLDQIHAQVGFSHQALVLPVLDVGFDTPSWNVLGHDYLLTRAEMEWALSEYAPGVQRTEPLLSPIHAPNLDGLPPALVVTGEFDPLQDEGRRYVDALRAAGVAVNYWHVDGLIHHAVMVPALIDLGRRVVEGTATAIGAALWGTAPSSRFD